ncbi:cystathionine beta-lyase [Clostridium saccharoperbutylacetonicum]|uniref:cysteine-S-conjugate beta-lyase n=1 Tax=Clostridium saccharoperbutylacetonicum N1-4(HMT) TaxID=931276 RepID=M1MFH4_9CLOT|nr:MalY/PatB family protein [Clostridium saccharoperbutylacetonicum]AGF56664.1 cystathionine beta-lyase PatB [Clostridium saccharoperbutylacetonicum N1-4(HMT)]NRT62581.1 cystathionine beta-lyase [Clostridium saccharoperbutylacetonicum]NSB25929.1 cystathionine beta-lyase [Clostridium saccharoperbutylacetonicum]NSB45287.1 cystathionine beta-lyase [Clostridium saccharoperbutylacetonicum]
MKYDFDTIISRKNTNSVKWDIPQEKDIIPMWIADMDFKTADPIIKALEKRVQHGIFGYAGVPDEFYEAEVKWWLQRHNFKIEKEWIEVTTGVIPSLSAVVQAFTEPGDKVLIQSPVYNYFNSSITNNKCSIVLNELKYNGDFYEIDFKDFEEKAADEKVKIFILCNPHNPVGRVWSEDELKKLGDICIKHNVIVLVDEIHRDLVYRENKHIPFAAISESFLMNSITCTAPSKTFNIAGLKTSNIIVVNEEYRKKVNRSLNINETIEPNAFGIEALIAAYNEGEEWLEQLLDYLQGNRDYLISYINERIPKIKVVKPEATYLIWIDCKNIGISSKELSEKIFEKGNLRINDGRTYGEIGEGFIRINIACPRALLTEGLKRLEKAIKGIEIEML